MNVEANHTGRENWPLPYFPGAFIGGYGVMGLMYGEFYPLLFLWGAALLVAGHRGKGWFLAMMFPVIVAIMVRFAYEFGGVL